MPTSEMTLPELVRSFIDLGALLTGPEPVEERLSALCTAIAGVLRCDHVAMMVIEGDTYRGAYQFGLPSKFADHFDKYVVSRDLELVKDIEACKSYLLFNAATEDPITSTIAKIVGVQSTIIVPFTHPDGEPLGYVTASYIDSKLEVTTVEAELATGLARLAQTTLLRDLETQRHREVSQAMLEVADSERRRLSRDIHDDPLQRILGLRVGLEAFREQVNADMQAKLDLFIEQCRGASVSLREVMLRTHPNAAELADLEKVLFSMARRNDFGSRPHLTFSDDRTADSPSYLVPAINRVAEQAARNTLRHADASNLTVRLGDRDGGTLLTVEDDGKGFDPVSIHKTRLGLVSMRERTELLGGTFEINSHEGEGTTVRAWFPHAEVDEPAR